MTAAAPVTPQTPEFVFRPFEWSSDRDLVFSAWLKGAWECEPLNKLPKEMYMPLHEKWITRCLTKARCVMLCHPDDTRELMGFIAFEALEPGAHQPFVVHWLYVKNMMRKLGIARQAVQLLAPGRQVVSTGTSKHSPWLRKLGVLIYPHGASV